MDIKNAQKEVDTWIKTHGVRYFNELTNMAQLTEEVGEVARIIARRYGEQSEKESDKNKDLGEELADVMFVVLFTTLIAVKPKCTLFTIYCLLLDVCMRLSYFWFLKHI